MRWSGKYDLILEGLLGQDNKVATGRSLCTTFSRRSWGGGNEGGLGNQMSGPRLGCTAEALLAARSRSYPCALLVASS